MIFWLFAWQVTISILVGMIFLDFAGEYKNPTAVFLGLAPFALMICAYLAWKRIKFD